MISKAKKKSSERPRAERPHADFEVASAASVQNAEVAISAGENVADAKATSASGRSISAGENRTAVKATSASGRSMSELGRVI